MSWTTKAALCAAACAWAMPAAAALYLKADITAAGTGSTTGSSAASYTKGTFSALLAISPVPGGYIDTTTGGTRTIQSNPYGQFLLIGPSTLVLTDNRLTYTQKVGEIVPFQFYSVGGGEFTFDFCLPSSSGLQFPTSGFQPVAGCAAVTYFSQGTDFQTRFSGQATSIAFSIVDAPDQPFGLTSATLAVPEPSTWALMLAGFGLTGYALRRRRARVAFA